MPKRRTPDAPVVRTTIELPAALWRAVRIHCLDARTNLRAVVIEALRAHLADRQKRRR